MVCVYGKSKVVVGSSVVVVGSLVVVVGPSVVVVGSSVVVVGGASEVDLIINYSRHFANHKDQVQGYNS